MINLKKTDPQIYNFVREEEKRQEEVLEMIPSENYTSKAVLEALGTVLNNKYSEGYPGRRYYQGNRVADEVEQLAIDRAKKLFGVPFVNVQALSGAPANSAVQLAVLKPGEKLMGLSLAFGGHLTHGAYKTFSSTFFKAVQYDLGKDEKFDWKALEKLVKNEKPKLIICGFTAYPRIVDFKKFAMLADSVGAYLLADISHISGLVASGVHPSPVNHAHIITTTTHKTLRGPRGALIMVTGKGFKKDPLLGKKIDSAIIPGLQGGPHDNQTAAIAVALREASSPSFKKYSEQVVKNAKVLAEELLKHEFRLVTNGTDNHLILIDLRNKGVNGSVVAIALEVAGIVANKNGVPWDTNPPFYPSGIRLGTPAITTRGLKEKDMKKIAVWMNDVVNEVKDEKLPEEKEKRGEFIREFKKRVVKNKKLLNIFKEVKELTSKHPVY
jgi:glycine hydroxymethyltransferase